MSGLIHQAGIVLAVFVVVFAFLSVFEKQSFTFPRASAADIASSTSNFSGFAHSGQVSQAKTAKTAVRTLDQAKLTAHALSAIKADDQTFRDLAQAKNEPAALPIYYRITRKDAGGLSEVAHKLYGHASDWPALWWANHQKIHNPTQLYVGEKLVVPNDPHVSKRLYNKALAAIYGTRKIAVNTGTGPTGSIGSALTAPAVPSGSLQAYAAQIFGSQYSCAANIIQRESGWSVTISNPSSGAYGIPQALPGSKMASAGADWATNGDTQLRWMLGYVDSTYGGACAAWAHWQGAGSY